MAPGQRRKVEGVGCVAAGRSGQKVQKTSSPAGLEQLVDARVAFTPALQKRFEREGYVLLQRFLTREGVALLRRSVDEVLAAKDEETDEEWIVNLHQVLPPDENWMWALATHPTVLSMVRASLGPNVMLYASQIHRKPPSRAGQGGGGHVVPMHQDGGGDVRTIWITLDDVDAFNGGLQVLRGWHTRGRLPLKRVSREEELVDAEYFARFHVFASALSTPARAPAPSEATASPAVHRPSSSDGPSSGVRPGGGGRRRGVQKEGEGEEEALVGDAQRGDLVAYRLQAGGLAMHHPLIPHGSTPNRSSRDRRVLILRYMAQRPAETDEGWARCHRGGGVFKKEALLTTEGAAPPKPARVVPRGGGGGVRI